MQNPFIRRLFSRKALVIVLVLLLPFLLLSRCIMFRVSDEKAAKAFENFPIKPSFHYYECKAEGQPTWKMHYVEIGSDTLPMVVFVHGSPGSWEAFISYFKDSTLLKQARLVSVDRPGFGYSDFGHAETSVKRQAALIAEVLRLNKSNKLPILVGHSLGGPVIARLAMDYPKLVGGLIFVAPSIDPALEKKEYYRYALKFSLISLLMPREFDVSNREIQAFKYELVKMLPYWKNISVPVTVIQGESDNLVDPRNADFAVKMLINANTVQVIRLPKVNHFIPWSHPQVIQQAILKHLAHECTFGK